MSCNDINECQNGMHNCNMAAKCSNVIGSFSCECNEGWEGDGVTCQNIAETERALFECPDNSFKSEIGDLLECICHPGYVMSTEPGVGCLDEDECSSGIHEC